MTRTRRRIAQQLVRNAARAKVVILTLGLVEAWRHRPTGLFANRAHPTLFNRYKDQFEFVKLDYVDTLECLEGMRRIIARHAAHPVQFVVTVSPVPLAATFTDEDVVIANTYSKSTLRAAASDFVDKHADVHYFPSYEIVLNTERGLAWRPDRIHVQRDTVRYIVNKFVGQYYEPDALTLV